MERTILFLKLFNRILKMPNLIIIIYEKLNKINRKIKKLMKNKIDFKRKN
jgi:hypothetical protein